ncbi:respiratory nitrate reductase subunit gamma [Solidesulfovibrio sp.]|uniref:respiratory nitrate reductase subunit gamma n=1 Tax=Solidesulfovibrio sp. TaxID=2910990 RepID=UPI00262938C5|nr:respiratory nitrate reductase subunit gamma [Solidesulfovibrio sp.]
MATLTYIVLVPMTYLAVGVFAAGTLWRLAGLLRRPRLGLPLAVYPTQKPGWAYALADALLLPTVLRHNPVLWVALALFHLGLLALVLGHLELVADIPPLQAVPHAIFLGKGAVGLAMLLCLLYFFSRRLVSPTKDLSVPEDYLLLALFFLTVLFGSQMDWARNWYDYSTMSVNDYRAYLWSLVTLRPSIASVDGTGHTFMLVAHVLCADLLLMAFPFTKLMHAIFTFALNRIRRG